jgi:Arc/MetJ family transcription regulator
MGHVVDDIDQLALEAAQKLLGTSSKTDTVNAALREIVRLRLVNDFFEDMGSRDPEELDRLQAEAWR